MRSILYATEAGLDVVNLADKFRGFSEAWSPRIVGDLNDMHVKVVKLRGEFVWHVVNERTVAEPGRM